MQRSIPDRIHWPETHTIEYALDRLANDEHATHVVRRGSGIWFAYRPAPSYPGSWGQKVFIRRDDEPTGWHLDEPWILYDRELPEAATPIDDVWHGLGYSYSAYRAQAEARIRSLA